MKPAEPSLQQQTIDARQRVLSIIWVAFLMTVGSYALLIFLLRPTVPSRNEDNQLMLLLVFGLVSASALALSFRLKRRFVERAWAERKPERVQSGVIIAFALCEMSSIFGLLLFFITGSNYAFILLLFSAVGLVLHRPDREQLFAAFLRPGATSANPIL